MNTTLIGLSTACALLAASNATAANHLLVEGVLKDGQGNLLDGTFDITFALYPQVSGGAGVYTETHLGVAVDGGLFQERLGLKTALQPVVFANNASLWLGVAISGQPELPRTPLETNPFAFRSLTAGVSNGLDCSGCVDASKLSANYASSVSPGGAATSALEATIAMGLACTGCVTVEAIAAGVLDAANVSFDDVIAKLGATTVQTAVEKLKALLDAGGGASSTANEGAGVVRDYTNQWGLPSYGIATEYMHLLNPSKPKVSMFLYGGQSSSFSSSNNLNVSNGYTNIKYTAGVNGTKGDTSLQIASPGNFNAGDHILIHQSVAASGSATPGGTWELNAVKSVQGNALALARPLENTYTTVTSTATAGTPRAQVVRALSHNLLEVGSGGIMYPPKSFDSSGDYGGIVYIRAQTVTVKSGGAIHADGYGYTASSCCYSSYGSQGMNECNSTEWKGGTGNYCSGGGGAWGQSCNSCGAPNTGAGGGGNKTAGGDGYTNGSYQNGKGGAAKGDAEGKVLHFGGAGGGTCAAAGSSGGGLVVIGAKTVIVEQGGRISANGVDGTGNNSCHYGAAGAGAGGTVAIFSEVFDNKGTVEAKGGAKAPGYGGWYGGAGGEGWVYSKPPISGIINQSFATGVEIWVDNVNITPSVGDPNGKGSPHWDSVNKRWGATGTDAWSTGPLDLSNVVNWTLGEHRVDFKETGGAGGDLKSYIYVIHPFSGSKAPPNDTCQTPVVLDPNAQPVVISGTTEDTMGKTKAADDSSAAGCGGATGPDVVYQITLTQRALLNVAITAPFSSKLYVRKTTCATGELVYCADKSLTTNPLDAGTYFLFVDSDAASAKGDFTLAVSTTPAPLPTNDTCASAQKLIFSGAGKASVQGTSLYALDQTKGLCPSALTGGPDVVFEFDAGTGQTLTANLTTTFSNIMYVTTSACGSAGVPLSCSATGALTIQGLAGGKYWLIVDGEKEKAWGTFDLSVELK